MSNNNALEIWQEQENLKRHRQNLEKFVGLVEQSIIENKALGVVSESIKAAILEKESFQKTVLLALPLLGKNERKKYLIQQISKRINSCTSGQMEIDKSDFLKMFLGDDYIKNQIHPHG